MRASAMMAIAVSATVGCIGPEGPEADRAGMDIVVQARSGLMAANGRLIDGRPAPGDPVSADYMCAMSLAFGVAAALLRREHTGRGGAVETSLLQAAMTLANNQLTRSEVHDKPVHDKLLEQLAKDRAAHVPFAEQAAAMPSGRTMPLVMVYFRTYETADAVIAIACGSHSLRERFMAALDMTDSELDSVGSARWSEHYAQLRDEVEALMRSKTSAQWTDILTAAGVPVSAVKFPLELFEDTQPAANRMFHLLRHPTAGDVTVLSPPVSLDDGGFQPAEPTAAFGSETQAILEDLGFSDSAMQALIDAGVTHRGR